MLERNGLVKGNSSRRIITAMDSFETDLRERRRKKLQLAKKLEEIENDYKRTQEFEEGKQT
jgi:hypothetical protein